MPRRPSGSFTVKQIANLKGRDKPYEMSEATGLRCRVWPSGRKAWTWRYRHEGRSRNLTLGLFADPDDNRPRGVNTDTGKDEILSLADARIKLGEAQKKLEQGIDPAPKAVEDRARTRQAGTVSELIDEYLKRHARPQKRSADEDERILNKDVRPRWGRRKAHAITSRDVVSLINALVDRSAPIQANRTLTVVKRMFEFGVSQHFLPESPAERVKRPTNERLRSRDRVLSEAELPVFWHGLDDAKMVKASRLALKMILATAQRPGEVAGAAKAEFNADKTEWLIPAARTKNRQPHVVPLSDLARELLEEAFELDADHSHVFPSARSKAKLPHMAPNSLDHAMQRALPDLKLESSPDVEIRDAKPHDLRRTASTNMTRIGHQRFVVDRVLNHVDGSIGRVYDRHDYLAEKRAALQGWADEIRRLLSGADNVVRLRQPAAND